MSDKASEISLDQLEEVAGGTYLESSDDAKRFLQNQIRVYGDELFGIAVMNGKEMAALRQAFAMCGVEMRDNGGIINANEYYIDGRKVSRDEAWRHVESQITH